MSLTYALPSHLPPHRKYEYIPAHGEGWGLYCESIIGDLMQLYKDPYVKFGTLGAEIWRASRLVVDTGIHFKGWTREQSIEFMEEKTGMSKLNIEAEVDRFISWPGKLRNFVKFLIFFIGQATAYKIGELKIRELKKAAENIEKFDIRDFHEVVLGSGFLTLDLLELAVKEYIEKIN